MGSPVVEVKMQGAESTDLEFAPQDFLALRFWLPAGLLLGAVYLRLALRALTTGGATLWDLGVTVVAFVTVVGWVSYQSRKRNAAPPLVGVLAFSLLFHSIGVLGAPILEDDFYRYQLDGWVFSEFGSPYGIAPARFFDPDPSLGLAGSIPDHVEIALDGVNNPEVPTIYGPTLQLIFRVANAIAPGEVRGLQLVMAMCSFALVCLLARGAAPLALLFFAWHPLLFKEFATTAHPDIVAVLIMMWVWKVRVRSDRPSAWMGFALGVAVGAKVFAILLAPFLLGRSLRGWAVLGMTMGLLYLPFVESIQAGASGGAGPYSVMGAGWLFNAPLYALLQPVLGPVALRLILLGLFGGVSLLWIADELAGSARFRGDRLFGLFLICLPVLNPWYLIWPFAFFVHRPTLWLGTASISLFLSYAIALNLSSGSLSAYEIPPWVLAVEFGAVALAFAIDLRAGRA